MEAVVEYLLKSAGALSIFVLIYQFLLRRLTFFQANRLFLLLGIIASIAFPLIEITQTVYVEQSVQEYYYMPQEMATPMEMMIEQPVIPVETPFDYWQLISFLYLAIVAFSISKMAVELSSLFRLIRSGNKVKNGKFIMVTLSRKLTPFSFFNYICYSHNEKSSAALDVILDHEKVHARQWHSVDVLLSHLYRAVFWINPLAWWLKKQIGENLEFIADAEAKSQTKSGVSYERTLLSSAAFHLQPALANNFFTPFIKKRIMMLQKEASARWNMYKYALILPLIVVFLYSFNVVTEVEYVERLNANLNLNSNSDFVIGDESAVENQNQIGNQITTPANEEDINTEAIVNDDLTFDITSKTTDQGLVKFAAAINDLANYKVKFSDQERDENKGLKRLSVSTKFPGKKWDKNMTIGTEPFKLLLIKASKEKLWVNDDSSSETMYVNKDGVHIEMGDDWTYGDLNIGQTEDFNWKRVNDNNANIYIKITATTTKKSLEQHKKWLKENHNVDFKYSKLKYKKDQLVAIKIDIDDNAGSKISQTYKNNTAIPNICIAGTINGNKKSWKLNNCEDAPKTAFKIGDKQYYELPTQDQLNQIQYDFDKVMGKTKISQIEMDSIRLLIEKGLTNIDVDSLENAISKAMGNYYPDSIRSQIIRGNVNDTVVYYKTNNVRYHDDASQNVSGYSSTLGSTNYQLTDPQFQKSVIATNDTRPLVIVDGVVNKDPNYHRNIKNTNIESMTILKNAEATSLYGAAGKDGVILITTKKGNQTQDINARRELLNQRRMKMDSLRTSRMIGFEVRREQLREKRDSMRIISDENRQDLRAKREFKFATKPKFDGKYRVVNRARYHSLNAIQIKVTMPGEASQSLPIEYYDRIFINVDTPDSQLKAYENRMIKLGLDFEFKTVKRNSLGQLYKLSFNMEGRNYKVSDSDGISEIIIHINNRDGIITYQ